MIDGHLPRTRRADVVVPHGVPELVATIGDFQANRNRRRRRVITGAPICVALVSGISAYVLLAGSGHEGGLHTPTIQAQADRQHAGGGNRLDAVDSHAGAPETSLAAAEKQVSFDPLMPDTDAANRASMTAAYEMPGNSIEMDYPRPNDASTDLYQPYISVWETPWTQGDPLAFYKEDIAQSPDVGKSICAVGDLPALCVEPRSSAAISSVHEIEKQAALHDQKRRPARHPSAGPRQRV